MRNKEIEHFKLWSTFRDQTHFVRSFNVENIDGLRGVFSDSFTQYDTLRKHFSHPPSLEALCFFAEAFIKWVKIENHSPRESAVALIEAVLADLKLVSIFLKAEGDVQIIFETLNGRRTELHVTDLIRNYIFMRAKHENISATELYEDE